jgi:hypothetical protein
MRVLAGRRRSMDWVISASSPKCKIFDGKRFRPWSQKPHALLLLTAEHSRRIQIEVNGKTPQGSPFSLVSSDPLISSTHDLLHYDLPISPFSSLSVTFKDHSTGVELFPCSANDRNLCAVLNLRPITSVPAFSRNRFESLALHALFLHISQDHKSPKPRTKSTESGQRCNMFVHRPQASHAPKPKL